MQDLKVILLLDSQCKCSTVDIYIRVLDAAPINILPCRSPFL